MGLPSMSREGLESCSHLSLRTPGWWETSGVGGADHPPNCRQGGRALSAEDLIIIISLVHRSSDFSDHLVPTTLSDVNDEILLWGRKRIMVGLLFVQFAAVTVGF